MEELTDEERWPGVDEAHREALAALRAVVEEEWARQEPEDWWEFNFTLEETKTLNTLLYYAGIELDRRIRDMEPEKNEGSGQQIYYARLVAEKAELKKIRDRVSLARP